MRQTGTPAAPATFQRSPSLEYDMSKIGALVAAAILAFVSLRGAALGDDIGKPGTPNGPPASIAPVSVTLQTVLRAYDTAAGISAHPTVTDVEEGTIAAYGTTGTYRDVYAGLRSGSDYRSTETVGPFTTMEGRYHGQRWRRDENGVTNVMQGAQRAAEFAQRSFTDQASDTTNDVKLLGEVTSPVDAYVVQVAVKGDSPTWGFFDKKTGLLDRLEIGDPDDRAIITYDDYRLIDGNREAWHTHYSDKHPENDYDRRITSDEYGAAITDADLAIPSTRQDFVHLPAGKLEVDLPSDVKVEREDGLGVPWFFASPYVTVTIDGRGLDMLLDSTESGMVLDDGVAKELGLTRYGPYDEDDNGSIYPTRSIVPSMSIGDLQLQNVAVSMRHVSYFDARKKIVGVIGFDFLADSVVEIDYTHHAIKAYDPVQFVPPADSSASPVDIDDQIPFVGATIGTSSGDYFMLDDTQPFTVLFPQFWQAHPDDVVDQGQGRGVNFSFFNSKNSRMRATQLKALNFGGTQFQEWLAYEATDTQDLEGVDIDGVIGCDFLQFFNVYFDYGHHAIYLEPNDAYRRAAHPASGY
jgi:aspartyl protease